jgi:hypothetical protein
MRAVTLATFAFKVIGNLISGEIEDVTLLQAE